jgi:hypothetical protein
MSTEGTKAIVMAILFAADRIRGTISDLQADEDDIDHPPWEYDKTEDIAAQADKIMMAAVREKVQ